MNKDLNATISVLADLLRQAELAPAAVDLESLRKVYAGLAHLWQACETIAGLKGLTLPVLVWSGDRTNNIVQLTSLLEEREVLSLFRDGTHLVDQAFMQGLRERSSEVTGYLYKAINSPDYLERRQRLFVEQFTTALRSAGIPVLGQYTRLCTWARGSLVWDTFIPLERATMVLVQGQIARYCAPILGFNPYDPPYRDRWDDALAYIYEMADRSFCWVAWDSEQHEPFRLTEGMTEEGQTKTIEDQLQAGLLAHGRAKTYQEAAHAAMAWLQTKGWRNRLVTDTEKPQLL